MACGTVVLQLVAELEDSLMGLLGDEDHIVRHHAATALAQVASAASAAGLQKALGDPSETVREAARHSLEERQLFDQWRQVWNEPEGGQR